MKACLNKTIKVLKCLPCEKIQIGLTYLQNILVFSTIRKLIFHDLLTEAVTSSNKACSNCFELFTHDFEQASACQNIFSRSIFTLYFVAL